MTTGPFARAVREALETSVSKEAAERLLEQALVHAGLLGVPEEVGPFRRFCEGPFRTTVLGSLGETAIEQVFERLGHVLWMATSDVGALEVAREWSRRTARDPQDDSGVRNLEVPAAPPPSAMAKAASDSSPRGGAPGPQAPGPAARSPGLPNVPAPHRTPTATSASIGRLRAPGLVPSPSTGSVPRPTMTELNAVPRRDPRSGSAPPAPLPSEPTPIRRSVPPEQVGVPTTVLAVTLDKQLTADLRQSLNQHCPVRTILAPSELAGAVVTAGERVLVLIDCALPSIDVPTFAGLAPILPAGARVVLWGATVRQQQRLASLFPHAANWVASDGAADPGTFILRHS